MLKNILNLDVDWEKSIWPIVWGTLFGILMLIISAMGALAVYKMIGMSATEIVKVVLPLIGILAFLIAAMTYQRTSIWRRQDALENRSKYYLDSVVDILESVRKGFDDAAMTPKKLKILSSHIRDAWGVSSFVNPAYEGHINILNTYWNITCAAIQRVLLESPETVYLGTAMPPYKDLETRYRAEGYGKHAEITTGTYLSMDYIDLLSMTTLFRVVYNSPEYGEFPATALGIEELCKYMSGSPFSALYMATAVITGIWPATHMNEFVRLQHEATASRAAAKDLA